MSSVTANGLEIGPRVPRVVGAITTRPGLEAFGRTYANDCDIAEVRLDQIGIFPGWQDACRAIEAGGTPVLLTVRSAQEGGKWTGTEAERLAVYRQGLACASLMDVEHSSRLASQLKPDLDRAKKALIVSFHDFAGTPSAAALDTLIREASPLASIVKIAVMVNTDADLAVLDALLGRAQQLPLCLIGMGAKGTPTRTGYPARGACLTYGFLDSLNAPGQISAGDLVRHLRRTLPAYQREFAVRHPTAASA